MKDIGRWMLAAVAASLTLGCGNKAGGPATPPPEVVLENTAPNSSGPPDFSILQKRHGEQK